MSLEGIILATGLKDKSKENKFLLQINGKSNIENTILGMYDLCQKIIVVGGHRIEDIWMITKKYPKIDLIYNHIYPDGIFTSLKTGLKYSKKNNLFITNGNSPFIKKNTYKKIKETRGKIIVPRYKGKIGHPMLISSHYKNEILKSTSYNNMCDFINSKKITYVDVDDCGILRNISGLGTVPSALWVD